MFGRAQNIQEHELVRYIRALSIASAFIPSKETYSSGGGEGAKTGAGLYINGHIKRLPGVGCDIEYEETTEEFTEHLIPSSEHENLVPDSH